MYCETLLAMKLYWCQLTSSKSAYDMFKDQFTLWSFKNLFVQCQRPEPNYKDGGGTYESDNPTPSQHTHNTHTHMHTHMHTHNTQCTHTTHNAHTQHTTHTHTHACKHTHTHTHTLVISITLKVPDHSLPLTN